MPGCGISSDGSMNTRVAGAFESAQVTSRRAYERGRLRTAAVHAVAFCLLVAGLSFECVGGRSMVWLPLTLGAWVFVQWRGVELLRGARIGALAGIVTLALPMSVLRRCCKPGALEMMGADCCTMPGACAGAGVLVGLVLACFLPTTGKRGETVAGMVLGMAAVAPMKCTTLVAGEALGLVGGLLAGVLAVTMVRAVVGRLALRA
jgi:hypothetical protein